MTFARDVGKNAMNTAMEKKFSDFRLMQASQIGSLHIPASTMRTGNSYTEMAFLPCNFSENNNEININTDAPARHSTSEPDRYR